MLSSNPTQQTKSAVEEGFSQIETIRHEMQLYEDNLNVDPEQALSHCTAALRYSSHSPHIHIAKCYALLKLKRYTDILRLLDTIKTSDKELLLQIYYLRVRNTCLPHGG